MKLYSRPGNDFTRRFPLIVETLARLRSRSCIIDGVLASVITSCFRFRSLDRLAVDDAAGTRAGQISDRVQNLAQIRPGRPPALGRDTPVGASRFYA